MRVVSKCTAGYPFPLEESPARPVKFIVEAIGVKTGGGVAVTRRLVGSLARCERHKFVALLPAIPEYAPGDTGTVPVLRFPPEANLARRHLLLNRTVPRICRREQADALLCLGNFPPAKPPCPTVVLLQNAWYVYDDRTAWRRLTLREMFTVRYGRRLLAARSGAAGYVVQTRVMKRRLGALQGGSGDAIAVIPTALPPPPPCARAAFAGPHDPFTFLCLSRYAAHKNSEILLEAVEILRKLTSGRFRCLLTTAPDEHPGARKLLRRIDRQGLQDLIVNRGPVPRGKAAEIYAEADALLLPTLLESYGLAYDEAMHFGRPILTSDREFAHERCRDAAIYFDPLDAESVARAMARTMEDSELRVRLVASGRRIAAAAPGWEEIAAQFVDVLERAATGRPIRDAAAASPEA